MTDESFRKTFYRTQFTALGAGSLVTNKAVIDAELAGITPPVSVPINETRLALGGAALIVEWASLPTAADVLAVANKVPTIVGVATTSEPIVLESFGVTQSASAVPVLKAAIQTPPLDGGTYEYVWNSQLKMNPAGANSGVQGIVRITRSDGVVREQPDSWDLTAPHAFNGSIIFEVSAGQTLLAEIYVVRLGGAGIAEMLGVRLTIDQTAAAIP